MLVAVLASIQTVLKCAEKAAGIGRLLLRYGALRRELETFLSTNHPLEMDAFMSKFQQSWNELAELAPTLPQKTYHGVSVWLAREAAKAHPAGA